MATAKKKKRFIEVEIPIVHKVTQMYAFEPEELDGKYLKYDLTRSLKGKGMVLSAKIKLEDSKAIAYPRSLILMPYFIRRMVRKGTNYVEDSFSTNSKDSQIKIKLFIVTRRKVSRRIRKALRNKAKEEIVEYLKDRTTEEVFEDTLRNFIQRNLSLRLKKIYPLSGCEVKFLQIEKEFENFGKEKRKREVKEEIEEIPQEEIVVEPVEEKTE